MKRYLVVFIYEGQFSCEAVMAEGFEEAVLMFGKSGLVYDEIYSITRAA